jgi:hypothetical protein
MNQLDISTPNMKLRSEQKQRAQLQLKQCTESPKFEIHNYYSERGIGQQSNRNGGMEQVVAASVASGGEDSSVASSCLGVQKNVNNHAHIYTKQTSF